MGNGSNLNFMPYYQERVNKKLESVLPSSTQTACHLHKAMIYAVMSGGKRLRPLFTYATGISFGCDPTRLDNIACAIELMHIYSLVHDDLPAMDDDDFRRGKPSCHKAFGEATAILTGDALQCLAFDILARDGNARLVSVLANACGFLGMVLGQQLDLETQNKAATPEKIEIIHRLKTGVLFRAAIELGVLTAGCCCINEKKLQKWCELGMTIGLIFQCQDDLVDTVIGDNKIPLTNRANDLFNKVELLLHELKGDNAFFGELIHFLRSSSSTVISTQVG